MMRGKIIHHTILLHAIFFLGCSFLGTLLLTIKPDVFFSGDAGLKFLMIKQVGFGGGFMKLDTKQPLWVEQIWAEGFFPFKPPFVYTTNQGRIVSFPPLFQLINAVFFKAFGFPGLYVIPCLSIPALWAWFVFALRKFALSPIVIAAALFLLAFCSPVTLYGAVYWEHSLAIFLVFSGAAFIVVQPASFVNSIISGVLTGLSIWLRPEAMVFCGLLMLTVMYNFYQGKRMQNLLFVCAASVLIAVFFVFNQLVYGNMFGAHSYQVLNESSVNELKRYWNLLTHINLRLIIFFPVAVIFYFLAAYLLARRPAVPPPVIQLSVIVICFLILTPLILPNAGGKQWGPRYFLPIIPVMLFTICASLPHLPGISSRQKTVLPVMICFAAYSFFLNVYMAGKTLKEDYAYRVTPGLNFLKSRPANVIVVQNQYVAQEFAAIFTSMVVFLAENENSSRILGIKLKSAGISDFVYISFGTTSLLPVNDYYQRISEPQIKGNYRFVEYRLATE